MISPRSMVLAATAIALLSFNLPSQAANNPVQSTAQSQPDNSHQNKAQSPTADKQPNAKDDRLTTANVRKAILADKDLSTYAHNVKIITVGGAVTLKGPVKSEDEKQKVASDVAGVVSADKITNQITVKQ